MSETANVFRKQANAKNFQGQPFQGPSQEDALERLSWVQWKQAALAGPAVRRLGLRSYPAVY